MPVTFEQSVAIEVRKLMAIKIPIARSQRLGMKLFPIKLQKEQLIKYERMGFIRGRQQPRGLGGPTKPVQIPSFTQFEVSPGYYGEHIRYDEKKLLEQRQVGNWMTSTTTAQMIGHASDILTERYCNTIEYNVWSLLQDGKFQAVDEAGSVYYQDMYDIPKLSPGTAWSNLASSTPLKDLRQWMVDLKLGKSVDFSCGELIMSGSTLNTILNNQNPADLGGKRLRYGETINNASAQNEFFLDADLPKIVRYDGDSYDANGTPSRFIRDGRIVLSGKRLDGELPGEYIQTPAAQNGLKPGEWLTVEDNTAGKGGDAPNITIRHGHNGCPVLEYPEAWAAITAY